MGAMSATSEGPDARRRRDPAPRWVLVVPVKDLDRAKSRLATHLPDADRRALALAMAADTLAACAAVVGPGRVVAVTSSPEVAAAARELSPALEVHATRPRGPAAAAAGLNADLADCLGGLAPGPVGVVTADLPALTPEVLRDVLDAGAAYPAAALPDHCGTGTTVALWAGRPGEARPAARVPHFGADSAARFRAAGSTPLCEPSPGRWLGARLDVDTPADLDRISALPLGPRTRAALDRSPGHDRAQRSTDARPGCAEQCRA